MDRMFGPKRADHPSVGEACVACGSPFAVGSYTTLVPLGPADDEEAKKMRAGRPYNAVAKEVHWECRLTPIGDWKIRDADV